MIKYQDKFYLLNLFSILLFSFCSGNDSKTDSSFKNDILLNDSYQEKETKDIMLNGDNTVNPDAQNSNQLVGDWFLCEDESCSSINYIGWRFYNNNTWSELYSYDKFIATNDGIQPYCYMNNPDYIGTYLLNENNLTLKDPKSPLIEVHWQVDVNKDRAKVVEGNNVWYITKANSTNAKGPCSDEDHWVCPKKEAVVGVDQMICYSKWYCDNGIFEVRCQKLLNDMTKYVCFCIKDGEGISSFQDKEIHLCKPENEVNPNDIAKTICNWSFWYPKK